MENLIFSTVYFEILIFITFFVFKIINKKILKKHYSRSFLASALCGKQLISEVPIITGNSFKVALPLIQRTYIECT